MSWKMRDKNFCRKKNFFLKTKISIRCKNSFGLLWSGGRKTCPGGSKGRRSNSYEGQKNIRLGPTGPTHGTRRISSQGRISTSLGLSHNCLARRVSGQGRNTGTSQARKYSSQLRLNCSQGRKNSSQGRQNSSLALKNGSQQKSQGRRSHSGVRKINFFLFFFKRFG